jgi:lipopolysaccharide/colanic/teichoic acid biosynthesis glycosyltransferase
MAFGDKGKAGWLVAVRAETGERTDVTEAIRRIDSRDMFVGRLAWLYEINTDKVVFTGIAYERAKRVMDIGIVLLFAPVWVPVIAMCAAIVVLDSPRGPAFFIQQRTGMSGRRFRMFKLRTMVPDASQMTEDIKKLSRTGTWPDIKIPNDPRVTRVGKYLRATHLDELPQLINVLRGDMSLVGPRPTSYTPDKYPLWHTVRLEVLPGITGVWQLTQRSVAEFNDKTRLDVAYINRRCVWVDIQILLRTVSLMFSRAVGDDA